MMGENYYEEYEIVDSNRNDDGGLGSGGDLPHDAEDAGKVVKVRLVNVNGELLTEATVSSSNYDPAGHARSNHCHARLEVGTEMPLWYGGTYKIDDTPFCQTGMANIYFSLPSGHENIWGQGNDFDVDTVRIHPDDIPQLLALGKSWVRP